MDAVEVGRLRPRGEIATTSEVLAELSLVLPVLKSIVDSPLWQGPENDGIWGYKPSRTCTLVVTSNVRQVSGAVPSANILPAFGNAIVADTTPADRRKSRRFMESPLRPEIPF